MVIVAFAVLAPYFRRRVASSIVDTSLVYRYLGPTLVCLISYAILVNVDMAVVRHYHSSEAAQYSAASLFGRSIGWMIAPLCAVLFPHVWNEQQEETNRALLLKFLFAAIALGVAGALVCTASHGLLTWLILGRSEPTVSELIPLCAWAMLPIGVANVFLNFVMARGRYGFVLVFVAVATLYLAAFYLWHGSLRQILAIVAAFGIVTLLLFVTLTYGMGRAKQT
jgi:O-antigen/teichoic acid export membrane protein